MQRSVSQTFFSIILFASTPSAFADYLCQYNDRGWEEHRGGHRAIGSSPSICESARTDCLAEHESCVLSFGGWAEHEITYRCEINEDRFYVYARNLGPLAIELDGEGRVVLLDNRGEERDSESLSVDDVIDSEDEEELDYGSVDEEVVSCAFVPREIEASWDD